MKIWEPISGETPIDPSKLRPYLKGRILNRAQLNAVEGPNILRAVMKYLAGKAGTPTPKKAPFTGEWAMSLHKDMLGKVWMWAGKLRFIELTLGVAPWQMQTKFYDLFADIHCWQEPDMPLIEQGATLHYRAVTIHPFENGNGRWARLLANIWLKQHRAPVIAWPEEGLSSSASPIRPEYIAALKEADKHNLKPLIGLHERYYVATTASHSKTAFNET